jgi:hypothetical protein
MATTIKQLLDKNKSSFDSGFYIETLSLSYILINKALKQIVKEDLKLQVIDQKIKTSNLISLIKKNTEENPLLKKKVSNKLIKDLKLFISLYKTITKELKFQFPEKKISDLAKLGIDCIIILNTTLVKIKNNKID